MAKEAAASQDAVRVEQLVKRYGQLVAVDGISFALQRGTCLGVLGPNGAGKTTTIEILEGLRDPDGGTVEVLGGRWRTDGQRIRSQIGVQLQETRFQEKLTVTETLTLFRAFYDDGYGVSELLDLVGLKNKEKARVGTLSGGQQQRLALGCALVNRPELLFLDEPTTGLDPQARRHLWEVVETFLMRGKSVLLTTHHMDEAERLADELIIVDQGKIIAEGTPEAIIAGLEADTVIEVVQPGHAGGARPWPTDDTLKALPGVREVRHVAGRLALTVQQGSETLPSLLSCLEASATPIADLRTHRPTLEDVFVYLTGRTLRDA